MIPTRYLVVKCKELTNRMRAPSFDGENDRSDIVTVLNIGGKITQNIYSVLVDTNDFTIKTTKSSLGVLNFRVEDEYGNLLNFGYDQINIPYDNQLLLNFNAHD